MSTDISGYPLPSYAATIWLAGENICIALPSGASQKSHTIRIPVAKCSIETSEWGEPLARQRGWMVLLDILKQRQQLREAPIGTRAAPVQYDIEEMLRAIQPKRYTTSGQEEISYDDLFKDEQQ